MFDLFVFSINYSDRVKAKFAIIKDKYPHAKLLVYRTSLPEMVVKARSVAFTHMFWLLDVEAILVDDFSLDWKPSEWDYDYIHVWGTSGGKIIEQGLTLWPKNLKISANDIKAGNFPVKMYEKVVTNVKPFDIFVFADNINARIKHKFDDILAVYPNAQLVISDKSTMVQLLEAQQLSTTKMFWFFNVDYNLELDLFWRPDTWDYGMIHAWIGKNDLDFNESLILWPVDRAINAEEFTNKTFQNIKFTRTDSNNKVVFDLVLFSNGINSRIQARYDKFLKVYPTAKLISNYETVTELVKQAQDIVSTKMFWLMDIEYDIADTFTLAWAPFPWDQRYVHAWDDVPDRSITKGLSLWPTDIRQDMQDGFSVENIKRLQCKAIIAKPYDIFVCAETNDLYVQNKFSIIKDRFTNATLLITEPKIQSAVNMARTITSTPMFWLFDIEYTINSEFNMTWEPDPWDQKWVHVWPSNIAKTVMQSLSLWPSDEELNLEDDYTVNNMKIMDHDALLLQSYDLFLYSYNQHDERTWQRYKHIVEKYPTAKMLFVDDIMKAVIDAQAYSTTKLFWLLDIEAELQFDLSWRPENWEQKWIYAWQSDNGKVIEQGLSLWPANVKYTTYDELKNIKFLDDVATVYRPYDVFFISFNEPNADKNFKKLLKKVPYAKRVNGIVGIHNAHKHCAEQSTTEMFWTIDADTVLDTKFDLSYRPPIHDKQYLHLWYTKNPVNDLVYGYGAVKLWPRLAPLSHKGNWLDFTTSVGNIKIMQNVVASTEFNSSSYDAWRSGFREAVKLCYNIQLGDRDESVNRLLIWVNKANDVKFAIDAKLGALYGLNYFIQSNGDVNALKAINDFDWLKTIYKTVIKTVQAEISKDDLFKFLGIDDV